ncbi:uncharacterized protein LOC122966098 isoform X3 [Scomber scombrus]|uniref:Uncharacterized protein LOC122966098 isoform X3 n=1 Tax=Scomber scombrus TaxID=13677 RepID=A0AAV1NV53_SCOSC
MIPKIWLIATFLSTSYSETLECLQRNISCCDIKTADGFKFKFGLTEGMTVTYTYVNDKETLIAYAGPSKREFQPSEVVSMDNSTVVRRHCNDTKVKHILRKGKHVTEHCVVYETTEKMENCDRKDSPKPPGLIIGVAVGVLVAVLCAIMVCSWKRYLEHLRTYCGHKQPISREDGGGEETSDDSTADGRIRQTLSLDYNLNDVRIEQSKNGNLNAPGVNGAPNHRAMNRNMRDDPGGDTRGQCTAWSSERHGSKDHVIEGQPLLSTENAPDPDLNTAGVSVAALVYKCDFDPDQVHRCSTVPDTDVKSMTPQHEEP